MSRTPSISSGPAASDDNNPSGLLLPLDTITDLQVQDARHNYPRLRPLQQNDIREALLPPAHMLDPPPGFGDLWDTDNAFFPSAAHVSHFRLTHPDLAWMSRDGVVASIIYWQELCRVRREVGRRERLAAQGARAQQTTQIEHHASIMSQALSQHPSSSRSSTSGPGPAVRLSTAPTARNTSLVTPIRQPLNPPPATILATPNAGFRFGSESFPGSGGVSADATADEPTAAELQGFRAQCASMVEMPDRHLSSVVLYLRGRQKRRRERWEEEQAQAQQQSRSRGRASSTGQLIVPESVIRQRIGMLQMHRAEPLVMRSNLARVQELERLLSVVREDKGTLAMGTAEVDSERTSSGGHSGVVHEGSIETLRGVADEADEDGTENLDRGPRNQALYHDLFEEVHFGLL